MEINLSELNKFHKHFAISCNGYVWNLLAKESRTESENFDMLHAAHTSLYHWAQIGTPENITRGEWLLSRVYIVLNIPDRALFHALNALRICEQNQVADFDVAYAHEALMRCYHTLHETEKFKHHLSLALSLGNAIADEEDKKIFVGDMGEFWK